MLTEIKWSASKLERLIIKKIAKRACKEAEKLGVPYLALQCAEMDIEAVHCNDIPLDLIKLHDAPEGVFGHDVFGIRRYLDRTTGKLTEFFVPRCAKGRVGDAI